MVGGGGEGGGVYHLFDITRQFVDRQRQLNPKGVHDHLFKPTKLAATITDHPVVQGQRLMGGKLDVCRSVMWFHGPYR